MVSSHPGAVGHAVGGFDDRLQLRRGNLDDLFEGLHFLLKGASQTSAGQAERAGEVDMTLRLLDQNLGQTGGKVNRWLFPVDGSGQRSIRAEALSTGQPRQFFATQTGEGDKHRAAHRPESPWEQRRLGRPPLRS